jgi:hypothetical protein
MRAYVVLVFVLAITACTHVRPSQRERLAGVGMQFEMGAVMLGQRDSVLEITEGNTFRSAGPGNAGAGCGCN